MSSPIVFPVKLHRLLCAAENKGYDDVVSWLPDGISFKVHDKAKFEQVMDSCSAFGGSSKFRSFQKNLNMWGFRAVRQGPERGACSHPLFRQDSPYLCFGMERQQTSWRKKDHGFCSHLAAVGPTNNKNEKTTSNRRGSETSFDSSTFSAGTVSYSTTSSSTSSGISSPGCEKEKDGLHIAGTKNGFTLRESGPHGMGTTPYGTNQENKSSMTTTADQDEELPPQPSMLPKETKFQISSLIKKRREDRYYAGRPEAAWGSSHPNKNDCVDLLLPRTSSMSRASSIGTASSSSTVADSVSTLLTQNLDRQLVVQELLRAPRGGGCTTTPDVGVSNAIDRVNGYILGSLLAATATTIPQTKAAAANCSSSGPLVLDNFIHRHQQLDVNIRRTALLQELHRLCR